MCSGPERMTLTDYGVTFFIRASAGNEHKIATLGRHEPMVVASAEVSGNDQEVTLVGRAVDNLSNKSEASQKDVKVRLRSPSATGCFADSWG